MLLPSPSSLPRILISKLWTTTQRLLFLRCSFYATIPGIATFLLTPPPFYSSSPSTREIPSQSCRSRPTRGHENKERLRRLSWQHPTPSLRSPSHYHYDEQRLRKTTTADAKKDKDDDQDQDHQERPEQIQQDASINKLNNDHQKLLQQYQRDTTANNRKKNENQKPSYGHESNHNHDAEERPGQYQG